MPEIKYQGNKGTTQKAQAAKFGNQLTGGKETKIYPSGLQVQKGAEPMQSSPDLWDSFTSSKKDRL